MDLISLIVATRDDFGKPSAVKRGRNPKFPYVPIIDFSTEYETRTEQIRGFAFIDRKQAIAHATKTIEFRRNELEKKLRDPRYRALRKSYNLPEELP